MGTGNYFDQCAFPCAIFAEERVYFSGLQIKIDSTQSPNAAKILSGAA
jgi:hypothetical protein